MKLLKKNDCDFEFISSKYFKFFTDCGEWFIYISLPKYTIRISSAGNYIYKNRGNKHGFFKRSLFK